MHNRKAVKELQYLFNVFYYYIRCFFPSSFIFRFFLPSFTVIVQRSINWKPNECRQFLLFRSTSVEGSGQCGDFLGEVTDLELHYATPATCAGLCAALGHPYPGLRDFDAEERNGCRCGGEEPPSGCLAPDGGLCQVREKWRRLSSIFFFHCLYVSAPLQGQQKHSRVPDERDGRSCRILQSSRQVAFLNKKQFVH